jgi:hypothetical protein
MADPDSNRGQHNFSRVLTWTILPSFPSSASFADPTTRLSRRADPDARKGRQAAVSRTVASLLQIAHCDSELPVGVASPNCCKSPKSRQGHGVGSPKSCKTKKGDLRREKNATAVGGD